VLQSTGNWQKRAWRIRSTDIIRHIITTTVDFCLNSQFFQSYSSFAGLPLYKIFFRTPKTTKTRKIQDTYQHIFQLVDPVSTTKVYKNEVLKAYEIDIYLTGDNDNSKTSTVLLIK